MNTDFKEVMNNLNKKYKNINVVDIIDNGDGSVSMSVAVPRDNASQALDVLGKAGVTLSEGADTIGKVRPIIGSREKSSVTYRDVLGQSYMDLAVSPDILSASPQELYKRSINYYKVEDVYGTLIDTLTNFSIEGFQNDIDDQNIRDFYDNWSVDVGFDEVLEYIFFDFFRTGFVRTFKVEGAYVPKVNYVSTLPGVKPKKVSKPAAAAAPPKEGGPSKAGLPIMYTVLDPRLVVVKNALFSSAESVYLKSDAGKPLKELMEMKSSDLSEEQKALIKSLPSKFRAAVKAGDDIPLEGKYIGRIDYRKQPYEQYPIPRGARAFTSMEYKKDLRRADSSTLDGITNYILLITVGSDALPVKDQTILDRVADLFDTPAKSFNVVWNHTLKVQKIVSPEIGNILGPAKYKQVNEDITGAWGVTRAIIDGVGDYNSRAVEMAVKSLQQEIKYARRKVSRWIYQEYRAVAEVMGFDRYPKVRFDNMVLKNEVLMMTIIQGLIDRRIISYDTGQKLLGLDPATELAKLQKEKPLVLAGDLGIIGSPYNPKATPPMAQPGDNVQDTQKTPKSTPSEGRPKGKPAKTPSVPSSPNKVKTDTSAELDKLLSLAKLMDDEDLQNVIGVLSEALSEKY